MSRNTGSEQALLYVVRHADAGIRGSGADDHQRSLTPGGWSRARVLADLLDSASVGDIVSSPFTRCVQTVEPLAARRSRVVALHDSLAEGADIGATLQLLRILPTGSVACTHGDMLGALARLVADVRRGGSEPIQFDKGGVWVLSRVGGALSLVEQMRAPGSASMHDLQR